MIVGMERRQFKRWEKEVEDSTHMQKRVQMFKSDETKFKPRW